MNSNRLEYRSTCAFLLQQLLSLVKKFLNIITYLVLNQKVKKHPDLILLSSLKQLGLKFSVKHPERMQYANS